MTGLSRHQQKTLRGRWGIPERARLSGPSPTSLTRFTHSPRARGEAAPFAAFCRVYGTLLPGNLARVPRARLLTLEPGERLCPTCEVFRACFPHCEFDLEALLSLVIEIARNKAVRLHRCPSCSAPTIIDRLAPNRSTCAHAGDHKCNGRPHSRRPRAANVRIEGCRSARSSPPLPQRKDKQLPAQLCVVSEKTESYLGFVPKHMKSR